MPRQPSIPSRQDGMTHPAQCNEPACATRAVFSRAKLTLPLFDWMQQDARPAPRKVITGRAELGPLGNGPCGTHQPHERPLQLGVAPGAGLLQGGADLLQLLHGRHSWRTATRCPASTPCDASPRPLAAAAPCPAQASFLPGSHHARPAGRPPPHPRHHQRSLSTTPISTPALPSPPEAPRRGARRPGSPASGARGMRSCQAEAQLDGRPPAARRRPRPRGPVPGRPAERQRRAAGGGGPGGEGGGNGGPGQGRGASLGAVTYGVASTSLGRFQLLGP